VSDESSKPPISNVNDAKVHNPEAGLERRILTHSPNLMLVEHRMKRGWKGARHAHPQEQLVYVLVGRLQFICGTHAFEIAAGDSFIVRGNVEHEAAALEDCVVIDVFNPTRPDYIS
jgi:quercetin dioxygenase-like cupin family protein